MLLRHGRAGDRSRERQVQQQQIRYWPPSVLGPTGAAVASGRVRAWAMTCS
jgi:hypothetical protein